MTKVDVVNALVELKKDVEKNPANNKTRQALDIALDSVLIRSNKDIEDIDI